MRKETGLEVTDRIELHILRNGDGNLEQAIRAHAQRIIAETLAITPDDQLIVSEMADRFGVPVELDLEEAGKCVLALAKAAL